MTQPSNNSGMQVPTDVRQAIRASDESIRTLAARHGLNPKTVAKWRGRADPTDRKRGPATTRSRTLTTADETLILAFRRYLPLSLDDSMAMLGARLPALSRSALHRLLRRHDLSVPPRRADFDLPIAAQRPGCFHIDIAPVATGGGLRYLFFAVEQSSALIFGLLMPDATQATARDFLGLLADGAPAPVRLVLTSDRFQFTTPGNSLSGAADVREALERGMATRAHPFEYACATRGIEHHLVPDHFPWDAARAERIAAVSAGIATMAVADESMASRSLHAELARHNDCPLPSLGGVSPGNWLARVDSATDDGRTMESWDDIRSESPPGRSRRDSTREAILEAAHIRLAHDGPEGLSLSEVARLAGVNRGTAYQHFKTRDRLIAATGRWMAQKLHRAVFAGRAESGALSAHCTGVGTGTAMTSMAERLASFAMDNPLLCRAWLLQLLSAPDPEQDLFWRDFREAVTTPDAPQRGMDRDVAAVAMLAGALLWPKWADAADMSGGRHAAASQFARAWRHIAPLS